MVALISYSYSYYIFCGFVPFGEFIKVYFISHQVVFKFHILRTGVRTRSHAKPKPSAVTTRQKLLLKQARSYKLTDLLIRTKFVGHFKPKNELKCLQTDLFVYLNHYLIHIHTCCLYQRNVKLFLFLFHLNMIIF